jgi:hypothetical protein
MNVAGDTAPLSSLFQRNSASIPTTQPLPLLQIGW